MKHFPIRMLHVLSARWLTPAIIALFGFIYVVLAFFTDEALVMLVGWIRNLPLLLFLLLIPVNLLSRLVVEFMIARKRRRSLRSGGLPEAELFVETVSVPHVSDLARGEAWLLSSGYRIIRKDGYLAAGKGITLFPARFLFLSGLTLFFFGMALSLATRHVERAAIIEGEPLPISASEGIVESIVLENTPSNPVLSRTLKVTVATPGRGTKMFGLYPPGKEGRFFLYHRYLGVAPLVHFSAPELNAESAGYHLLLIYPPGRQDTAAIQGSPYLLEMTLVEPPSGVDPYETSDFIFRMTCKRGAEPLFTREIPLGGSVSMGDVTISIPAARRFVATDLLVDHGIRLLWLSGLLLLASFLYFLPVRVFAPRREIVVAPSAEGFHAFSRAEGKKRKHDGYFHEFLDLITG